MAIYPVSFSSNPSLGPAKVKTKSKRGVVKMACKTKKSSAKKSSSKKSSSCKKKPC